MQFRRIFIEISNVYSPGCTLSKIERQRPAFMDARTFEKIISEVKDYTDHIWLSVWGEPLENPEFETIMDLCDKAEIHVTLSTNGIHLGEHPSLYMHSCLSSIRIHLSDTAYYPHLDLATYMNSIMDFAEHCSMIGHPECELHIDPSSSSDAVHYCMQRLHRRYRLSSEDASANHYRLMPSVMLIEAHSDYADNFSNHVLSHFGRCQGGVDELAILTNANIIPCQRDVHGEIAFDNLRIHSLEEFIEHNGRYHQFLQGFEKGKLVEPLCARCPWCTIRKKDV